jgi:hypothetical protein
LRTFHKYGNLLICDLKTNFLRFSDLRFADPIIFCQLKLLQICTNLIFLIKTKAKLSFEFRDDFFGFLDSVETCYMAYRRLKYTYVRRQKKYIRGKLIRIWIINLLFPCNFVSLPCADRATKDISDFPLRNEPKTLRKRIYLPTFALGLIQYGCSDPLNAKCRANFIEQFTRKTACKFQLICNLN